MPPKPAYISVQQAAKRSGIHPRRLQEAANRGDLKARKLSDGVTSAWLIHPNDLDRYVARRQAS